MERGVCRLCDEVRNLCYSHIDPELLYRPLYDETGRALALAPESGEKLRKIQKGLREYLLCEKCETGLNKAYEQPFSRLWNPESLLLPLRTSRFALLRNVPYETVKLFCLSILWKADVSSLGQFSSVSVGPMHRKRLRQMLRTKDAGGQDEYQIVCSPIETKSGDLLGDHIIAPPEKVRVEGHHAYMLTFGACSWLIFVTSHRFEHADRLCLKETGELPVARLPFKNIEKYAA